MNIPTYAPCSQCKEFSEDRCDWTKGTCAVADAAAREGMTTAGITPLVVRVTIAWNAKPCSEWEASQEGRRDIEGYEAEAASIAKAEGRAA